MAYDFPSFHQLMRCVKYYVTVLQTHRNHPDSKVHEANMGPIWGRQDPGGPHVGPMNFVIWELSSDPVWHLNGVAVIIDIIIISISRIIIIININISIISPQS